MTWWTVFSMVLCLLSSFAAMRVMFESAKQSDAQAGSAQSNSSQAAGIVMVGGYAPTYTCLVSADFDKFSRVADLAGVSVCDYAHPT
jgi:hypothetical protein